MKHERNVQTDEEDLHQILDFSGLRRQTLDNTGKQPTWTGFRSLSDGILWDRIFSGVQARDRDMKGVFLWARDERDN